MTRRTHRKTARPAFTLVELLVVVAIIALLAAILVPMLRNAQKLVHDTGCMSFMKAASTAYLTYSSDHDGVLLRGSYPDGSSLGYVMLHQILRPYFDRPWYDPAGHDEPGEKLYGANLTDSESFYSSQWLRDHCDYGIGETCHSGVWVGRWYDTPTYRKEFGSRNDSLEMPIRMAELPSPGTTGMFFCREAWEYYGGWFTGGLYITSAHTGYGPWPLHRNDSATNVVRMDGSIRTYPWVELLTANVWPQEGAPTPPAGRRGSAREYLYSGWEPDTQANSGWLSE